MVAIPCVLCASRPLVNTCHLVRPCPLSVYTPLFSLSSHTDRIKSDSNDCVSPMLCSFNQLKLPAGATFIHKQYSRVSNVFELSI